MTLELWPSAPAMSMREKPSLRLKVIAGGASRGPDIFMVTLPSKLAADRATGASRAISSGRRFFMGEGTVASQHDRRRHAIPFSETRDAGCKRLVEKV